MRVPASLLALTLLLAHLGCGGRLVELDVQDPEERRQAVLLREAQAARTLASVPADADIFGQVRIAEVASSRSLAPIVRRIPGGLTLADVVATQLVTGALKVPVVLPGEVVRVEFSLFGDVARRRKRLRMAVAFFGAFHPDRVAGILEGNGWTAKTSPPLAGSFFTHPTLGVAALLDDSHLAFATDKDLLAKIADTCSGRTPSVISGGRVRTAFSSAMDGEAPLVEVFFPVSETIKLAVRGTLEGGGSALGMIPGVSDLLGQVANVNTGRLGLVEEAGIGLLCVADLRMVDVKSAQRTADDLPSAIASLARTVRTLSLGGDQSAEVFATLRRLKCTAAEGSDTVRLWLPVRAEDLAMLNQAGRRK